MTNYKVRIQKNKKDFQILENNMPIIKGSRPKWYSSRIIFFYNNKTFEIKKVSFWKSQYSITAGGIEVAKILVKSLKGYFIQIIENNRIKQEYTVSKTSKSMWSSERLYTVLSNQNEVLKIDYKWLKHSWIKYTEDISLEVINHNEGTPELMVYSLFVMRLIQQAEAAASSGGAMVYG
tara:strand:- start:2341 stop:2874 length:534 start_codon:yes stop_codon:yes gene_type:complete